MGINNVKLSSPAQQCFTGICTEEKGVVREMSDWYELCLL